MRMGTWCKNEPRLTFLTQALLVSTVHPRTDQMRCRVVYETSNLRVSIASLTNLAHLVIAGGPPPAGVSGRAPTLLYLHDLSGERAINCAAVSRVLTPSVRLGHAGPPLGICRGLALVRQAIRVHPRGRVPDNIEFDARKDSVSYASEISILPNSLGP